MTADQLKQMSDGLIERLGWFQRSTQRGASMSVTLASQLSDDITSTLTAYQDLTTRLLSQSSAQEVLIGEHVAKQREAEAEVEALKADNASMLDSLTKESTARCEAEEDAARYRWIRQSHWYVGLEPEGDLEGVSWCNYNSDKKPLDDYVDAALSAATEGGK